MDQGYWALARKLSENISKLQIFVGCMMLRNEQTESYLISEAVSREILEIWIDLEIYGSSHLTMRSFRLVVSPRQISRCHCGARTIIHLGLPGLTPYLLRYYGHWYLVAGVFVDSVQIFGPCQG